MKTILIKAAVVALLAVGARPSVAQESEYRPKRERDDVHLRNDCRLAVQVLTHGQPANKREWALDTIDRCDESGPPVLARMWREVAADSASVGHMIYRSVYMRDRRVYNVVSTLARDRSVPALKRAAALHLLGRWARPGFTLEYQQFFSPEFEFVEKSGVVHSSMSHDTQYDGAEALPSTVRQEVLALARELAIGDPNFRLRATAALLVGILD
jgi:hypothetical protein